MSSAVVSRTGHVPDRTVRGGVINTHRSVAA